MRLCMCFCGWGVFFCGRLRRGGVGQAAVGGCVVCGGEVLAASRGCPAGAPAGHRPAVRWARWAGIVGTVRGATTRPRRTAVATAVALYGTRGWRAADGGRRASSRLLSPPAGPRPLPPPPRAPLRCGARSPPPRRAVPPRALAGGTSSRPCAWPPAAPARGPPPRGRSRNERCLCACVRGALPPPGALCLGPLPVRLCWPLLCAPLRAPARARGRWMCFCLSLPACFCS